MFRRCKSKSSLLNFLAGHERVNDDSHADQWQWNKSEPNFWSGKILCSDYTNLRPDDCPCVHDERDQNIYVALNRVA